MGILRNLQTNGAASTHLVYTRDNIARLSKHHSSRVVFRCIITRGILKFMKISRAFLVVSLAGLVLFLYAIGLVLEFHWRVSWYDHVVHILAGATASLTIFSLQIMHRMAKRASTLFIGTLLVSLIVGGLWEIFELSVGITSTASHHYAFDTTLDLIFDVIGGFLGGIYIVIFK